MKGEKSFDDAQGDMKKPKATSKRPRQRGQSGQGGQGGSSGEGAAVDAQGRALEALRDGAQG